MKQFFLAAALLLAQSIYAQKVESTEIEVPIKHTALFPFAAKNGCRLQAYFIENGGKGDAISLDMEVISRLDMFASFDLDRYGPHVTGKDGLKVVIKVGTPVVSFENAQTPQGYYFKKGNCILPATAEISNDKGEILKTLVVSNDQMKYTTYYFSPNVHKQNMVWFKEYYGKHLAPLAMDSARRIFAERPSGVRNVNDLDASFNRDALIYFTDQALANAYNNVLLNLNYMLKAGLESIDRTDKYKVYTIGPKKEKEAGDYVDEQKACDLLTRALDELKKNNFELTPSSTQKLQEAKVLFNKLIERSETDLKQGMKSALKFNSEYYNALFCNGALTDMFLGYYEDAIVKVNRYEPAEKLGDAFSFKKMMNNTNYKIDFTTAANFREKIMKGILLMKTLNP
jgi:hypothetical protein